MNEREILDERARVFDKMTKIRAKLGTEDVTAEDRAKFDRLNGRITELNADLERIHDFDRLNEVRTEVADQRADLPPAPDAEKLYEHAFLTFLRDGNTERMSAPERDCFRTYSNPESINRPTAAKRHDPYTDSHGVKREVGYEKFRTSDIVWEERAALDANALTAGAGAAAGATGYTAGYLIPQGFWANLQIALKAYGGILPYIQMIQTDSGQPLPWPTVDPTQIVGRYITEQNQLGFGGDSNGTDYQFGQGMLNAYTLVSGVILASVQLLNDSAFDVDGFVSDRIGESIGRKVAAEIHTGTGANAFLGIETALSARGHQASPALGGVYLSGSATKWAATAGGSAFTLLGGTSAQAKLANGLIGFDDILGMIATVDPAYRNSGRCIFVANDITLAMLRTITDAYGHPLWQPAVAPGQPDTLYNYPIVVDQNTSGVSTTASTAAGLLFGDFKVAMVARQVNGATMMRLTERYADYLQVGYLGYVRMDARSNDLRAAAIYSTNAT